MKKILLLAQYFPPSTGGTQSLYYHLCNNFDPDKIVVLTQKFNGWQEFDKKQRFKIYRVDHFSHIDSRIFREVVDVENIIRKEKIQNIIFGHINFCLTALILRFMLGKKYYLYVHGEEITKNFGGKYYQFFKWNSLRYAKGVIAVSDFTKKLVEPYNPNSRVIYNAVDLSEFKSKEKDKELLQKHQLEDKKVLLTISRLENRKGHDKVIKILPQLIQTYPDITYLIGGSGDEEQSLKTLVEQLKLHEYVEFLGKIPSEKLLDYYNLCDIFVMPVREMPDGNTEGFGIVFLEANACGKPVIGGDAGGVPSAIKDGYNGFLIDGNNEKELYIAIEKLLQDDSLRENISKNALEWVKDFTYKRIVKDVQDFLE